MNYLEELENEVFKKRTVLGQVYKKNSSKSLLEFAGDQLKVIGDYSSSVLEERRNELVSTIGDHIEGILGKEVRESISNQLQKYFSAITADHHGPITDPGFLNNNLLTSSTFQKIDPEILKNVFVLSSANVSFDNDSFPRGHMFHSFKDQAVTNQLVFFPRKVRPLTVAHHPSHTENDIAEAKKRVEGWVRDGTIGSDEASKIHSLLNDIYGTSENLNLKTFADQVTKTNFKLWKKLFEKDPESPNLLYVEQERIVNSLLLSKHINSKTIVNKLLFEDNYSNLILKYFDGISGAFAIGEERGTFLFWALPKDQKYKIQLWKKGNKLVSKDDSYSIDLTPESISKGIQEKELLPSTALSFIILSFYHGLILTGGGGQTTYQTHMKNAYIKLLEEIGEIDEASLTKKVPTDTQALVYPGVAFLQTPTGEMVPATTLDLLLHADHDYIEKIHDLVSKITVKQNLARVLPLLYSWLTNPSDAKDYLLKVTPQAIDEITGFTKVKKTLGMIK